MNRIIHLLALFIAATIVVSCGNNTAKSNEEITVDLIKNPVTADGKSKMNDLPEIKFEKLEHNFGILLQGEKVSYTFKFKNIGKQDLIIKDASASCGCTIPKFSRKPIKSGESGEIEIVFDSNKRTGRQVKSVTVWTNCQPNQTKLKVISEIVVPK